MIKFIPFLLLFFLFSCAGDKHEYTIDGKAIYSNHTFKLPIFFSHLVVDSVLNDGWPYSVLEDTIFSFDKFGEGYKEIDVIQFSQNHFNARWRIVKPSVSLDNSFQRSPTFRLKEWYLISNLTSYNESGRSYKIYIYVNPDGSLTEYHQDESYKYGVLRNRVIKK